MKHILLSFVFALPVFSFNSLQATEQKKEDIVEELHIIDYKDKKGCRPVFSYSVIKAEQVNDAKTKLKINKDKPLESKDLLFTFDGTQDQRKFKELMMSKSFTDNPGARNVTTLYLRSPEERNFKIKKIVHEEEGDKTIPKDSWKDVLIEKEGLIKVVISVPMSLANFKFSIDAKDGYVFPLTVQEGSATKSNFTINDIFVQRAVRKLNPEQLKELDLTEVNNPERIYTDAEMEKIYQKLKERKIQRLQAANAQKSSFAERRQKAEEARAKRLAEQNK